MIATDTTIADWSHLIRGEYLEIPGLHLSRNQVLRLWGLDEHTGDAVLKAMIEAHFLRRTETGAYVRENN